MSKIDQIDPGLLQRGDEAKRPRRTGPGGEQFQKALDEALEQPTAPAQAEPAAPAPDPLAHLEGVLPPVAPAKLDPVQSQGVMQAERTLDALERFEQALGNSGRSLKQIAPLVRDLEDEVGRLNQVLAKLDSGDELHPILSQVAATALVQSLKFNRGDYI